MQFQTKTQLTFLVLCDLLWHCLKRKYKRVINAPIKYLTTRYLGERLHFSVFYTQNILKIRNFSFLFCYFFMVWDHLYVESKKMVQMEPTYKTEIESTDAENNFIVTQGDWEEG